MSRCAARIVESTPCLGVTLAVAGLRVREEHGGDLGRRRGRLRQRGRKMAQDRRVGIYRDTVRCPSCRRSPMAAASWLEGSREMLEGKAPVLDRVSLTHTRSRTHTHTDACPFGGCVCLHAHQLSEHRVSSKRPNEGTHACKRSSTAGRNAHPHSQTCAALLLTTRCTRAHATPSSHSHARTHALATRV